MTQDVKAFINNIIMMNSNFKTKLSPSSQEQTGVRPQEGEEEPALAPTKQAMYFSDGFREDSSGMHRVKSNESSDYLEMLGMRKEVPLLRNNYRSDEQQPGMNQMTKKPSFQNSIKHANKLRRQLQEKQELIQVLEDHNVNIFADVGQWMREMENTYHSLLILNKEYQRKITELEIELKEREEELSAVESNLTQTTERMKKMENQAEMCEKVKKKSKEDYNQLALLKQQQIFRLEEKIKNLQGEKSKVGVENDQQIYELNKENKNLKERIHRLDQYIQGKDEMTKKLSSFNNDLVLENQILKQKQIEQQLKTPKSQNKELLQLKSKYKLLEEMNRKLEIELEKILHEAEAIRKRQSIMEMEMEQLEQQLQANRRSEKHQYSYRKDRQRSTGKIKQQRLSHQKIEKVSNDTVSQKIKEKQNKIKQLSKSIFQLKQSLDFFEKSEIKRQEADEIIISGLKKKVENIGKQVSPLGVSAEKIEERVYQLLQVLDQLPLMKAEYLRNGYQNTKLLELFGQQSGILRKIERFYQRSDKSRKRNLHFSNLEQSSIISQNSKELKKVKLQIQVDDDSDQKVEKYLYEQLKNTYNTQGVDSYTRYDIPDSIRK